MRTVRDLITALQALPPDAEVVVQGQGEDEGIECAVALKWPHEYQAYETIETVCGPHFKPAGIKTAVLIHQEVA